jgi:argininosuccinate lyase
VVYALAAAADSVTLLRLGVAGVRPRRGAMLARAIAGQTTATAAAERLVVEHGLSFREAHHLVGELLTEAEDANRRSSGTPVVPQERRIGPDAPDPAAVARAARFGGGPGAATTLDDLRLRRAAIATELADRLRRRRRADVDLAAAVAELTSAEPAAILARAGKA